MNASGSGMPEKHAGAREQEISYVEESNGVVDGVILSSPALLVFLFC